MKCFLKIKCAESFQQEAGMRQRKRCKEIIDRQEKIEKQCEKGPALAPPADDENAPADMEVEDDAKFNKV
jgi:hypothetical protein